MASGADAGAEPLADQRPIELRPGAGIHQEMPTTTAADAWQRAVTLTSESRLKIEAEPRIEHAQIDDIPKASHPFFWAGCMLVNSGSPPPKPEPRPPAAVKKPPKPGARN